MKRFNLVVYALSMLAVAMPVVTVAESQTQTYSKEIVETYATFQQRPGNPAVSSTGRVFASYHPMDKPAIKYIEVLADGKTRPFPNSFWSEDQPQQPARIAGGIAIRIGNSDGKEIVWMLDMGDVTRSAKLVGWDLSTDQLYRQIVLPKEALGQFPFVQDFALDQKRQLAYIADPDQGALINASHPAFIVVDLKTGESRRVLVDHPSTLAKGRSTIIDGRRIRLKDENKKVHDLSIALDPITIDPNNEWVYFGAMTGDTIYRIPADSLANQQLTDQQRASTIEVYGPKPMSDGISVDSSGNVYVGDLAAHAIGVIHKTGNVAEYRILEKLPQDTSWLDGFAFANDGWLYATVNQLDRAATLNAGVETGNRRYQIIRLRGLAPSAVGR